MRGILNGNVWGGVERRFIPADAGNTRSSEAGGYVFAVHPRGCGEYARCTPLDWLMIGSSPRMRGIRSASQRSASQRRFIPADAGNTTRHTITSPMPSVHPRGCGEYGPSGGGKTFVVRFIPADAGNTTQYDLSVRLQPVHPRGCGEYFGSLVVLTKSGGSSPRMRGILHVQQLGACRLRFIPADAGNT